MELSKFVVTSVLVALSFFGPALPNETLLQPVAGHGWATIGAEPAGAAAVRPPQVSWDQPHIGARGLVALSSIDYRWRDHLPGWEIRFHAATDGAYGYTLTQERVIDIYVRPEQSDQLLAHVVAHELGHAVDVTLNDGDDRRRWQQVRQIESAPWWPDSRASDFATGAGDFAESFAAWQVGSESFRSTLGPPPSDEALALVAELAQG